MKQIVLGVLVVAMVTTMACNKPSEDNCRKALLNMQHVMNTEHLNDAGFNGEVRRCKGGSTKAAVDCAIKATTLDELLRCDFYKVPGKPTTATGSAAGSGSAVGAAPPAGSVTGLDTGATGSGGPASGTASGTASGPMTGSAAGPMTGSATGTTTGSASGTTTGSAADPAGSTK